MLSAAHSQILVPAVMELRPRFSVAARRLKAGGSEVQSNCIGQYRSAGGSGPVQFNRAVQASISLPEEQGRKDRAVVQGSTGQHVGRKYRAVLQGSTGQHLPCPKAAISVLFVISSHFLFLWPQI